MTLEIYHADGDAVSDEEAVMNDRKPILVRLPEDLKAWLAAEAQRNGSPQNSEVIRALRERQERIEDGRKPNTHRAAFHGACS